MTLLAHRIEGTGPPLILLNGIAMTMASWAPIAGGLARDFSVIRCDFRGQLLSPGAAHRDVSEHARDVGVLLDHLDIKSAHIVATSFGGAVGAIFASEFSHRTQSLISIASADAFDQVMAKEIRRWRQACVDILNGAPGGWLGEVLEPVVYSPVYLESHGEERQAARTAMGALPSRWFSDLITLLDSADTFNLSGVLGRILCPTLVAAAELDLFVPRKRCQTLAEGIFGAEFRVIGGAGHAAVAEDPEAVLALVRKFITGLN